MTGVPSRMSELTVRMPPMPPVATVLPVVMVRLPIVSEKPARFRTEELPSDTFEVSLIWSEAAQTTVEPVTVMAPQSALPLFFARPTGPCATCVVPV